MRDIRRPYRNLRSNNDNIARRNTPSSNNFDNKQIDRRDISEKAEIFERGDEYEYQDIEFRRDGKPIMKASNHFDLNNKMIKRKKRNDFDILKREEFFNSKKRDFDEEDVKKYKKARNKSKRFRNFILYFILIILILGFFAFTFIFNKASININPKYKDIDISNTFLIFKDDILIDTISSTSSKTVLKSEPKEINQKATGEITIYNNYSEATQILIKNTRFQSKDGKIFKIGDSVKVPGKVGNTPGSIKVKVSADSYGAEYNIDAGDFTIPGFKGTARYEGFYAKSDSAMKGGSSGMVQIVSQSDIDNANLELKSKVESDLASSINLLKHEGYYTLYGQPIISFTDNSNTLITSDENTYNLIGTASVFSIKKEALAKMIASQILGDEYNNQDIVRLENIDNLGFTLSMDTDANTSILKVYINGKARIIWDYNKEELKNNLADKNIKDFNEVIKKYNYAILNATSKIEPFWARSFPNSINRIKIIEEIK